MLTDSCCCSQVPPDTHSLTDSQPVFVQTLGQSQSSTVNDVICSCEFKRRNNLLKGVRYFAPCGRSREIELHGQKQHPNEISGLLPGNPAPLDFKVCFVLCALAVSCHSLPSCWIDPPSVASSPCRLLAEFRPGAPE